MGQIIFPHQTIAFDAIAKGLWKEENIYFKSILNFCQQWLNGLEEIQLQTSGSTGIPKSIKVSRNQMKASALATKDFFKIPDGANLLCVLNTDMIAGKMMLIRAMEWEASIIVFPPSSDPFPHSLSQDNIDFVALVPLQVATILNNPNSLAQLKKVKHVIMGGASPSQSLLKSIIKQGLQIYQTFGMTETVSHIALAPIIEGKLIYKVMPGIVIGADEDNKLWINGTVTNEQTITSNDQIKMIGSQAFEWLGRTDFVINSGGIKIHPEILESVIEVHISTYFPNTDYFLYGIKDEKLGQKLMLCIEQEYKNDKMAKKLLQELKNHLPIYQVPKGISFINKLIKTPSGKINRLQTIQLL